VVKYYKISGNGRILFCSEKASKNGAFHRAQLTKGREEKKKNPKKMENSKTQSVKEVNLYVLKISSEVLKCFCGKGEKHAAMMNYSLSEPLISSQ
jgi:hypothetical protein